jgi:hypothetical protein
MNVSDRPTFLTVPERFMTVSGLKKVKNVEKRPKPLMERSCKHSGTVNDCNDERIEKFEPEHSNVLERKVESFHGMFTFTL